MDDLLREGIAAARSGQREHARELLLRLVEQDEKSVSAWLWLSSVVESLEDREIYLENVLALEPDHDTARQGLAWVRKQKETSARAELDGGALVEGGRGGRDGPYFQVWLTPCQPPHFFFLDPFGSRGVSCSQGTSLPFRVVSRACHASSHPRPLTMSFSGG